MATEAAKAAPKTRSVNIPVELHARLEVVARSRVVGINLLMRVAAEEALARWEADPVMPSLGSTVDPGPAL